MSFKKHEKSDCHKSSVECIITLPTTTKDVGEMLSQQHAVQKVNRETLLQIISAVRFLARQGLALRGDGDEMDGNLSQLLLMKADSNPNLSQ